MRANKMLKTITLALAASAMAMQLTSHPVAAKCVVIALDVSKSTPAIDPIFLRAALPKIRDSIISLPIGSLVKVFTVGSDRKPPLHFEFYVQRNQTSEGDLASELANAIPIAIANYMGELRANPSRMQNESNLSAAFLDASKSCDKSPPCSIIFLTDGIEDTPGSINWHRNVTKPLPNITGLDLRGASIYMYGVGRVTTPESRFAIEKHWRTWLKKANAGDIEILRL
jgi:hypothetical protein